MPGRPRPDPNPDAFRDAISQWQLAARTEVKRSSALPSSMFDMCDPMLEARLAESVDHMLRCLRQPDALRAAREYERRHGDDDATGKRLERVDDDDMRGLPRLVAGALPELDVDEGLSAEYLGLLVDACTTGDTTCRRAARELLARDFGVPSDAGLERAAAALREQLAGRADAAEPDGEALERLSELCGAIAAAIVAPLDEGEGRPA